MADAKVYKEKLKKCIDENFRKFDKCHDECMNDLESDVIPHINENMRKYNKCHDKCMNDLEICIILDDEYDDCHEWCQKMYSSFQDIIACKKDCSDTYGFLREDIVDNLSTQRSPIADEIDIYNSMSI